MRTVNFNEEQFVLALSLVEAEIIKKRERARVWRGTHTYEEQTAAVRKLVALRAKLHKTIQK